MTILQNASEPLSAASLCERTGGLYDPATVYRTLHWLEENGHAESFVLHCTEHGTERFFRIHEGGGGHHHWFHCENCHRFTDLGDCHLNNMVSGYQEKYGVTIKTHNLYFTGICGECRRQ